MKATKYLLPEIVMEDLMAKHGCFQAGDSQGDVSKAFASDVIEARERLADAALDLLVALDDVMVWIKNWSPIFTEENEWAETAALVGKAKAKVEGRAA